MALDPDAQPDIYLDGATGILRSGSGRSHAGAISSPAIESEPKTTVIAPGPIEAVDEVDYTGSNESAACP